MPSEEPFVCALYAQDSGSELTRLSAFGASGNAPAAHKFRRSRARSLRGVFLGEAGRPPRAGHSLSLIEVGVPSAVRSNIINSHLPIATLQPT